MRFRGIISAGKLSFTGSRVWVANRIKEMPDQEVSIEITKYKKPRSLEQNAYLHGILIPCFREALYNVGYDEVKTDSQAKQIMKNMFLKTSVVNHETGEVLEYVKDTRDLNTEEMGILFEDVWRFCADTLGYIVPAPGAQSQMFIDNK